MFSRIQRSWFFRMFLPPCSFSFAFAFCLHFISFYWQKHTSPLFIIRLVLILFPCVYVVLWKHVISLNSLLETITIVQPALIIYATFVAEWKKGKKHCNVGNAYYAYTWSSCFQSKQKKAIENYRKKFVAARRRRVRRGRQRGGMAPSPKKSYNLFLRFVKQSC